MKKEIIISGFGGQGVLSMGKILAYSGLMDDKEVTWMPAYGPEQRGGTANVTVIVSDEKISSPILSKFDIAIVLNQPSLEKFEPKLKPGGILIYDGYGIINPPTRKDITVYRIDAMDKAAEMKNAKVSCRQYERSGEGSLQNAPRTPPCYDSSQYAGYRRRWKDHREDINNII